MQGEFGPEVATVMNSHKPVSKYLASFIPFPVTQSQDFTYFIHSEKYCIKKNTFELVITILIDTFLKFN